MLVPGRPRQPGRGGRRRVPMPRFFTAAILSILALSACGDSLVLPSEGQPSQVTVQSGAGQQATVGTALAESVVVRITDGVGRPVARLAVAVNLAFGGGISPAGLRTDDNGLVAFRWSLGPAAGQQTIEVGVGDSGNVNPKAIVAATATPGPPRSLTVLQGNLQAGETGKQLADSLVVRVTDGFGNRLRGVSLTWTAQAGTISPAQLASDASGRAASAWTLGPTPGVQTATVVLTAYPGISADFGATATP